jgi:endonuclease/exonuclease/phosphatase family metal-dependent hydrolase
MKIIYLNAWSGRRTELLEQFVKKHHDVDIFCFQEVYHEAQGKEAIWSDSNLDLLNILKETLKDYHVYYDPHLGDYWGLAMFVHKDLKVLEQGDFFVHQYKNYHLEKEKLGHTAKNIQHLTLQVEDYQKLTIINFHGLWNGQGKGDTEDRLTQSDNIIAYLKTLKHSYILGGDFNLSPDTTSLKKFEDIGLRNLIKEYKVASTRTSLYPKEEKFADYVFVPQGVHVEDFQVLPDEVSDHAPLYIKVSV